MIRRIVISRPYIYEGEAADIVKMLSLGIERFHIRKPHSSAEDIAALVEQIPEQMRISISLNDHLELARPLGVGGINLNSRYPTAPSDFHGLVSRSCHTLDELWDNRHLDYLFLSPVYESISKSGHVNNSLALSFNSYRITHLGLPPVIALGGIRPWRFHELTMLGFGGAAMLGAAHFPLIAHRYRLQYITPSGTPDKIIAGVEAALDGGCRWVQLRMKDSCAAEIVATARRLAPLCHSVGAIFVLDDRVDLVGQSHADGVHLGKNDMHPARARQILGPGYVIGATANTFDDIAAAAAAGADYIGLGPFRHTETKRNLSPLLGIEGYTSILDRCRSKGIDIPVVAIGGITPDDIPTLARAGADAIAVSGAIAAAANPEQATKIITDIINSTTWTNS